MNRPPSAHTCSPSSSTTIAHAIVYIVRLYRAKQTWRQIPFCARKVMFPSFCSPSQLLSGCGCFSPDVRAAPQGKVGPSPQKRCLIKARSPYTTAQRSVPPSVRARRDVAPDSKTSRLPKEMQNRFKKKKKKAFISAHVLVFWPRFCAKLCGNATKFP